MTQTRRLDNTGTRGCWLILLETDRKAAEGGEGGGAYLGRMYQGAIKSWLSLLLPFAISKCTHGDPRKHLWRKLGSSSFHSQLITSPKYQRSPAKYLQKWICTIAPCHSKNQSQNHYAKVNLWAYRANVQTAPLRFNWLCLQQTPHCVWMYPHLCFLQMLLLLQEDLKPAEPAPGFPFLH